MCGPVLPAGGEGYGQGCGVCGFVFPDSRLRGTAVLIEGYWSGICGMAVVIFWMNKVIPVFF